MNIQRDLIAVMPSYQNPELLREAIPAFKKAAKLDSELIVVLNSPDSESVKICNENGIDFIVSQTNYGTVAVDFAMPRIARSEMTMMINDDMIMSDGFDIEAQKILLEPATSCSATLVEPENTGNPIVIYDDLGGFAGSKVKFDEKISLNTYQTSNKTGWNHPIIVRTSDYLAVGGYSNNLDMRWAPLCYSLDPHFAWRLWKLHGEKFNFVISNKFFSYHGISMTNRKIPRNIHALDNGYNNFQQDAGMTVNQFKCLVGSNQN
jgi:hypothetical protein